MNQLPKGVRLVWCWRDDFIDESVRHAYRMQLDCWHTTGAGPACHLESEVDRYSAELDEQDLRAKRRTLAAWVEAHADEFTYSDLCVRGITARRWTWSLDRALNSWRKARREASADAGKGQSNG